MGVHKVANEVKTVRLLGISMGGSNNKNNKIIKIIKFKK